MALIFAYSGDFLGLIASHFSVNRLVVSRLIPSDLCIYLTKVVCSDYYVNDASVYVYVGLKLEDTGEI